MDMTLTVKRGFFYRRAVTIIAKYCPVVIKKRLFYNISRTRYGPHSE